jgi:hypothetical protein
MTKGMALAIGLNNIDNDYYENHYNLTGVPLPSCENDANDMAGIAVSRNFQVETLCTEAATRENVINGISRAAKTLKPGDIFMLSYSGHGYQVRDENGDEPDKWDETWCLFNDMLIDDELNALFTKFAENVRILVFSDSCHSGTVTKAMSKSIKEIRAKKDANLLDVKAPVKASVLLISACRDNQEVDSGEPNSRFTSNLKLVWDNGNLKYNYKQFYKEIYKLMPDDQKPNYYRTGKLNPEFEKEHILKI